MVAKPMVVVLAGPPCSGKSTAGAWLASTLSGIHLQVDAILTAIIPDSDRRLEHRRLAYNVAARAIKPVLDRGLSVVLDCTYSRKEYREHVVRNVPADVPLVVIEFLVSIDTALERFASRGAHHAIDLTSEIVAEKVRTYPYGAASLTIDSEAGSDEIRARILHSLGEPLRRESWIRAGI